MQQFYLLLGNICCTYPATSRDTAPHLEEEKFACLPFSRFLTENSESSEEATGIIEASWRSSTKQRYQGHMCKFSHYCLQRNINPAQADFKIGIEYLTQYFYTGVGYSSVNTARSVIFSILKPENGTSFEEEPLVCRLLKGVFNLNPSLPWYTTTWDVSICFRYIKSLPSPDECDLKTLSYRLAILLDLKTGQRDQKISYINLDLMKFETDKVTIFVPELLKQMHPGHHLEPMVLMQYSDTDICALSHLEKYREVTNSMRKSNKLLLSFVKPHKAISTSTLSRWCISTLQQAGVDMCLDNIQPGQPQLHIASIKVYLSSRLTKQQDGHLSRRLPDFMETYRGGTFFKSYI